MGGNIFNSTGPIKKENIEPTLKKYYDELTRLFPKKKSIFKKFKPVGSVGKKAVSGDIDLAIDVSMLVDRKFSVASIEKWGLNASDVTTRFNKLKARARSATDSQIMVKAMLQEIGAFIKAKSNLIEVDLKKITLSNLFGAFPQFDKKGNVLEKSVQVDWMVGNIKWLQFSYYSEEYKGNVKGLHRTQLMLALFSALGYTFNHGTGVKRKSDGEVVAETPVQAMGVLSKVIGQKITSRTLSNYFLLRPWMEKMLSRKDYDNAIDTYLRILDRTRCDIPDDLQDLWIARKRKLKLTGKFLPKESKLKIECSYQILSFDKYLKG